eukprot:scaffold2510_cov169-Amphora_coffeaeformis.AAC.55
MIAKIEEVTCCVNVRVFGSRCCGCIIQALARWTRATVDAIVHETICICIEHFRDHHPRSIVARVGVIWRTDGRASKRGIMAAILKTTAKPRPATSRRRRRFLMLTAAENALPTIHPRYNLNSVSERSFVCSKEGGVS